MFRIAAVIFLAGLVLSGFAGPAYPGDEAQSGAADANSPAGVMPAHHPVVTPYGDFCPKCSRYGVVNHPVVNAEAVAAMHAYFHAKGLSISNVRNMGRFMMADVYQEGRLVDTVIFDRRTGRLRSIF